MRSFAAVLLPALAAASLITHTSRDNSPDLSSVQISAVAFSGTGCPTGSVSTDLSPDKTVVTFGFDAFQTYIGAGTTVHDHSKNCQLHLNLTYSDNLQFAVVGSTYHSFAQLDTGLTYTILSTYYFPQNASATTITSTTITGGGIWAEGQVYTLSDPVPTASYIYSPCSTNSTLDFNDRIAISTADSTMSGQIPDDETVFTHQVHLNWLSCTP